MSAKPKRRTVRIKVDGKTIRAVLLFPSSWKRAVILANGAGADMESDFIKTYHERLAAEGYLSVKFNFPYQEEGRSSPDKNDLMEASYLAVIDHLENKQGVPRAEIVAGGKSMGGRIASQIAGRASIKRLFFLGYPLHPAGKPEKTRDAHLYDLKSRMLFVAGTRDSLCDVDRMERVVRKLAQAKLVRIPNGDHSFKVPKKLGGDAESIHELIVAELRRLCG